MTGAERGFLLLGCHLGNPERRPLTAPQLRRLARRVRDGEKPSEDRDLELRDLTALGYGHADAAHMLSLLSEEALLDRYLAKAANYGCTPLTPLSPLYPRRLLKALGDDAPACLWARGDLSLLQNRSIALVGSRDLLSANARFARLTGAEAAGQGFALISGNARGADRTAQNAALAAGGCVISILADRLTDHVPAGSILYLSEEGFDLEFSAQRALSRNRCIHALGELTIAAQCSLRTGGTWDGSVKNLRFGWSPLYVFDDGSESADLLEQMGAVKIGAAALRDLNNLPCPDQLTI
ncbi:MAG: DNA-processing protein DprA [Oscillospiraceae bacterium]|nr:DNA-processing protein DprA [Oscillospiraceae bacterium]